MTSFGSLYPSNVEDLNKKLRYTSVVVRGYDNIRTGWHNYGVFQSGEMVASGATLASAVTKLNSMVRTGKLDLELAEGICTSCLGSKTSGFFDCDRCKGTGRL